MKGKALLSKMDVLAVIVLIGCSNPVAQQAETTIDIVAISGVISPVTGEAPVKMITETTQYMGAVSWSPVVTDMFVSNTTYTATITLIAKAGYTLSGVAADSFIVEGATNETNSVNSGVIVAEYFITTANVEAVSELTGTNVGTLKAVQGGTFHNGIANMTVSSFRMSQHEITRTQFLDIMDADPSNTGCSSGASDPVQYVNWYHAIAFCNKLSVIEGLTPVYFVDGILDWEGLAYNSIPTMSNTAWNEATANWSANGYRLPTEAEWQFAARGGNNNSPYDYSGSDTIDSVAWYYENSNTGSGRRTQPVGIKEANELGLQDMSGNVFEWCWDWHADSYPVTDLTDNRGPTSGTNHIVRGGSYNAPSHLCYISNRGYNAPNIRGYDLGFRVVRP